LLDTGLAGRTCLVTGAAGGIGRATAALLAEQGADVVPCDREPADVEQLAEFGRPVAADLSSRSGVARALAFAHERHGRLDVVIHCAAIYRTTPLPDVTDDEWDAVIAANLRSSFLLCQGAVEMMREHGDGRIVLFGSFSARTGGLRAGVPYAASKAGVEGVMRNVAAYAGPLGVRVNCIHPGYVETQMVTVMGDAARTEAEAAAPLRRTSKPPEQAMMAVVLASDLSSFVHGVTLDVNGGIYMA
jgi:NAD(P)-dependent dehydrogenase (short-subunit alcohol dehydrogenase family)